MSSKAIKVWVWLIAIIPLLGWGCSGLMDLDEGFYGAIAAEMNRTHEWLIPLYNGHPWFEKPILIYWLTKPSLLLFGNQWGPRLPSILASLGTLAMTYWFIKKRLGLMQALTCLLVLSTCFFFAAVSRYLLCDPLLVFCLSGCFFCFWESFHSDHRWRIVSAAFLGLSVLAKGPVGCALFVPLAIYVYWREPALRAQFRFWEALHGDHRWRLAGAAFLGLSLLGWLGQVGCAIFVPIAIYVYWRQPAIRAQSNGSWLLSVIAFTLVVASWYLPAYRTEGHTFVQGFLIDQNIGRFEGGDAAHKVTGILGLIYYSVVLLVGALPWSIHALRGWPTKRIADQDSSRLKRFAAAWLVIVVVFFTISGSKLPTYALPAFPPLAILAGIRIWEVKGDLTSKRLFGYAIGSIALCAFLTGGFWWYWKASGQAEAQQMATFVRQHALPAEAFVEFNMSGPRPKEIRLNAKSDAPGPIPVNRTALPSLLMYANRNCLFLDKQSQLLELAEPAWIIARSDSQLAENPNPSLRPNLTKPRLPFKSQYFDLFYYQPETH